MLAAILLLGEPEAVRAELLEKTSLVRKEAKDRIGAGTMTLDGLSMEQNDSIFGRSPGLRQSFQKILSVMGG